MSSRTTILALDIGGANIKASDGADFHTSRFFPLWKDPTGLSHAIVELVSDAPPCPIWAVTMTGELADCFRTKREGVAAIVDAVVEASGRRDVRVYLIGGRLVPPEEAKRRFMEAAASNWHALAAFVARRYADLRGLLIDIGSTTCDIIPFVNGKVVAAGKTDPERLTTGELVYTGVVRSPICAVTPALPWRGKVCGTAQELFATTLDAYLILGELPEDETDVATADGRPATLEYARDRLARAICADREMFDDSDAVAAARFIRRAQIEMIADAGARVLNAMSSPPILAVVSGQGEFLARAVLEHIGWAAPLKSLADEIGRPASRVAPAYALARLAREIA